MEEVEIHSQQAAAIQLSKIMGIEQSPMPNPSIEEERQTNFLVALVRKSFVQARAEGDQISIEGILDQILAWEHEFQFKDLRHLKPVVLKRLRDRTFGAPRETEAEIGTDSLP